LLKCNLWVAGDATLAKRNLRVACSLQTDQTGDEAEAAMSDSRREVQREAMVDAPPEQVWEALTDERLLGEWLADEVELDPVPGGEATFRFGDSEERRGTVLRVEEGRTLAFNWARPGERETEVELSLVPAVAGTRVVVVERATAGAPVALAGGEWQAKLATLAQTLALVLA
jgi:uncharacterized protein YndB with AHSA1/START domain